MSLHGGLFENVARKLSGFLIFRGSDSTFFISIQNYTKRLKKSGRGKGDDKTDKALHREQWKGKMSHHYLNSSWLHGIVGLYESLRMMTLHEIKQRIISIYSNVFFLVPKSIQDRVCFSDFLSKSLTRHFCILSICYKILSCSKYPAISNGHANKLIISDLNLCFTFVQENQYYFSYYGNTHINHRINTS